MHNNPYESPKARIERDYSTLPILPRERWDEVNVQATVERRWWLRRVYLTGSVDSVIEYNPIGVGERVYVDDQLMVTTPGKGMNYVQPHIDFVVEAFGHVVLASIDVKASFLFFKTYAFRLTVAGKVVYDETV